MLEQTPPMRVREPWRSRSHIDLLRDQLDAIDRWAAAQHLQQELADTVAVSRESRLDIDRRIEVRRREQAALVARAHEQLAASGALLQAPIRVRALVAHRQPWLRDKLADLLERRGVEVVGLLEDGADAAAAIVVEQPDLALLEHRLPTLTGLEVLHRCHVYAPDTRVGLQAQDGTACRECAGAGADAVFERREPPADVVDRMLGLLDPPPSLSIAR